MSTRHGDCREFFSRCSIVIDYGDLRQRDNSCAREKADDYDWAQEAISSYALADQTFLESG